MYGCICTDDIQLFAVVERRDSFSHGEHDPILPSLSVHQVEGAAGVITGGENQLHPRTVQHLSHPVVMDTREVCDEGGGCWAVDEL